MPRAQKERVKGGFTVSIATATAAWVALLGARGQIASRVIRAALSTGGDASRVGWALKLEEV